MQRGVYIGYLHSTIDQMLRVWQIGQMHCVFGQMRRFPKRAQQEQSLTITNYKMKID